MMLLGLDPGSQRMGWCVGSGDVLPFTGAWRFEQTGDDLGAMLAQLDGHLSHLLDNSGVTNVAYEAPILLRHDSLARLRKTLSLGAHIEFACHQRGIPCSEVRLQDVKRELSGNARAEKDLMVTAAQKLGIALPTSKADGREDAADAVGVWLLLLRAHDPERSREFDRRLFGVRGQLAL